jgi:hypothetical protein
MTASMPASTGEFSTRLCIWLALVAYAIGAGLLLKSAERNRAWLMARWCWTVGCLFFLGHVLCAFRFFHHWSPAEAYRETARQTAQLTGWNWGGGIYFNYAVAAGWTLDVLWWWLGSASFARRPNWIAALWHGFLFFMVFNGTIVFGHGPVRLLGILICTLLGVQFARRVTFLKT